MAVSQLDAREGVELVPGIEAADPMIADRLGGLYHVVILAGEDAVIRPATGWAGVRPAHCILRFGSA